MRIIRTDEASPNSIPDQWERDQIYNGLDCAVTAEVLAAIEPQLDSNTLATYEFSKALQGPVLEMRLRGVLVDATRKAEVISEYYDKVDQLSEQLDEIVLEGVGMPSFNWRSNKDLQALFYKHLQIPIIRKQGRPTCDRDALERMESYLVARPIVMHLSAMRELQKRIDFLRTGIDPDGRVRTSYNIAGTNTGRFSSSFSEFGTGGNLQNVEESLRSVLIADPGMKFAKFDAKSGESYIVGAIEGNLFNDWKYLEAVDTGDVHTAVARICWPNLPWTGNLKRDKEIAEQPFYRHYSYRFMCKKLGHGCLTPDHEVLTPHGWVSIAEKPTNIMTWTDAKSEFQKVSDWTDFLYTGYLHVFEDNSISLIATEDHRIPYKKDLRYSLEEAIVLNGPQSKMPLGHGWIGGNIEVPARLIAAYMCDGSLDKWNISFHFAKERKVMRLIELLEQENIQYNHYINNDGTYKITIQKFNWPKRPGSFMFDWTEECISDFIDELKWWDGYIGDTSVSISCKNKEDLEWYQTFGRLLGIGGQIQKSQISGFGTIMYRLQQNNKKWASGSSVKWSTIDAKDERVLCPTVKASWFYVRRNGKISVTGNSNYGGKPTTLAQQAKLPERVVIDFQPKYFRAFPSHIRWQGWTDDQLRRVGFLITLTGRKRWFFGRRTEPATLREAIAYNPQGSLADIVNHAMLRIWRQRIAIVMMQDHDAITFMYPEEREDEIIPQLQKALVEEIPLEHGRTLCIPYDCKVGYNKGEYCCGDRSNPKCKECKREVNLDGLKDYEGHDKRKRQPQVSIMDRIVRR